MTDLYDRATEREEAQREDALNAQRQRAGFNGKTIADSATHCSVCECRIPKKRRELLPGVQTCVDCQTDLERALRNP